MASPLRHSRKLPMRKPSQASTPRLMRRCVHKFWLIFRALESQGRYKLMVWPVHCVIGAWGHNIHSAVLEAVGEWELQVQRGAFKVLKGQNPLTEQYSAIRAEVPRADDPRTQTDHELIEKCRPKAGLLLVAGRPRATVWRPHSKRPVGVVLGSGNPPRGAIGGLHGVQSQASNRMPGLSSTGP